MYFIIKRMIVYSHDSPRSLIHLIRVFYYTQNKETKTINNLFQKCGFVSSAGGKQKKIYPKRKNISNTHLFRCFASLLKTPMSDNGNEKSKNSRKRENDI